MSIHDHKTATTIVAELMMTRTKLPNGSFLLLEGPDDKRFWNRWVDGRACTAVISGGKLNLLGALRKLDVAGFGGTLGVADADLDRLHRMVSPSPNFAWTQAHDLETSLIQMGAARAVVEELGDIDRLHAFEQREKITLEAALLGRAVAFGRIRCARAFHAPEHDLSWLRVLRFVDHSWTLDQAELARVAAEQGLAPALHELGPWLDAHAAIDPWDLVNGHDLVELLTAGLHHALGSLPGSRGSSDVASALRLAVDSTEVRRSALFHDVQAWEQRSASYAILRSPS